MKLLINLSIIFFIALNAAISQPKIEIVGGDTYDWGVVDESQTTLKAKVKIKNAGTEKLNITEVKPTCGCTTAPLDKNELQPGETATLDITLRIGGSSNEVSKTIRIMSNDPKEAQKILWLKCKISREFEISPQKYFSFQDMTVGNEKSEKVILKNNSKDVIKVSNFVVEPKELTINLKGEVSIKPGQQIELIATAKPKEQGNFRGSVTFKTSQKDNNEITLNAFGRVKPNPIFNDNK
jgi:LEA14-like dessication related protein